MPRHRQTSPAARSPRLRPAVALAAAATWGVSGCIPSGLVECCGELRLAFRTEMAAEKAYLHREDVFHECCSSPKDFKHGFKNGYVQTALRGDDCCAPPVPPKCFWGSAADPCERAELINCYYDGWAHGAVAAGQDGVVGVGFVPVRNMCDPSGAPIPPPGPPPGTPGFGPGPLPDARPDGVPGIGDPSVPPAPAPATAPFPEDVTAAPAPRPLGLDGNSDDFSNPGPVDREGSGGNPGLLDDLLDAAEPAEGDFPDAAPGDPFGRASVETLGIAPDASAAPDLPLPAAGTATLDLPAPF